MHNISPFFRSPWTDITGGIVSYQMLGRCQKQEMAMMDCLEAYGLGRGLVKCKYLLNDYQECHTRTKQFKRFFAMRRERDRQIAAKKLTCDDKYCSPVIDSY
ncbi:hypothetical protein PYW08_005823 [Mythimna loreyi]|uniref:Uncharacterized protein n=1 Tax=Mythimna loreyi TaxID=667449 RepID=A0ACC2QK48_9NEOP|nr:hypothetical protein PYW08_005823 [Mythimna loreyi]